ncbi:hypothetical protein BDZ89DRAFT_1056340 [Hymenopellis radicata]|nr:hypothetical protein BDZ89DRAFT_1056340 [Hymenopellis radicata]
MLEAPENQRNKAWAYHRLDLGLSAEEWKELLIVASLRAPHEAIIWLGGHVLAMRSSLAAIHPADQMFEISSSLNLIVVGACREVLLNSSLGAYLKRPNKKAVEIMKARGVPRSILDDYRCDARDQLGESFGVWDTANQKWTGTSIGIYELEGIIAAVGGTSYSLAITIRLVAQRRTATSPCHPCPIISPRSNGARHSFPVEFTSHL